MTDKFNPDTHKFGMAYLSMGRFLVYPNTVLDEQGRTVCLCPNDDDFGYLDPALLTRAPEHDLVPRQAVTGDADKTVLDGPEFDAFVDRLNEPPKALDNLVAAMKKKPVWEDPHPAVSEEKE